MAESEEVEIGKPYVTRFTYHISDEYAEKVYESCSKYGLSLCGPSYLWYGCSKKQMYTFLGKVLGQIRWKVFYFLHQIIVLSAA